MVEVTEAVLTSPWLYVGIFIAAAIDGLFLPSDSVILAASVAAAVTGRPSAVLVALTAAVGVALGDELGYFLGSRMGQHSEKLRGRPRRLYTWAAETLSRHGILLISGARYIPFGRIATVLAAGGTGYPKLRFTIISSTSAVIWAGSLVAIGYASARNFRGNPLTGLLVAIGCLVTLTLLIRLTYRLARGRPSGEAHRRRLPRLPRSR